MIPENRSNRVYFSAKLPEACPEAYREATNILDRYGVQYGLLQGTKDIWVRDFMPLQVTPELFQIYNYTPDYLTGVKKYRSLISDPKQVCIANGIRYSIDIEGIRIDGGNVVHSGTKVIMTAKVFEECLSAPVSLLSSILERELRADIIFLPWDQSEIYGHADGIVRFVDNNTVIMTNYHQFDAKMAERYLRILKSRFKKVHVLEYDVPKLSKYSWAYINWLQTDKVLILPKFGIPEDEQALRQISEWMPEYCGRIEMADARDLIPGGGCFNCASWTTFVEASKQDSC